MRSHGSCVRCRSASKPEKQQYYHICAWHISSEFNNREQNHSTPQIFYFPWFTPSNFNGTGYEDLLLSAQLRALQRKLSISASMGLLQFQNKPRLRWARLQTSLHASVCCMVFSQIGTQRLAPHCHSQSHYSSMLLENNAIQARANCDQKLINQYWYSYCEHVCWQKPSAGYALLAWDILLQRLFAHSDRTFGRRMMFV